jgi:peptidyl-prolyl cis-trans isomerase SurA
MSLCSTTVNLFLPFLLFAALFNPDPSLLAFGSLDPPVLLSYSRVVRRFCFALMLFCSVGFVEGAAPRLVNGIIVIVGEEVITRKDLELTLTDDIELLERRYASQPTVFNQKLAELEKARLEEMVENKLVLQEFKRAGYVIPESYFQGEINKDIRRYGDRLTLTKTLQAQGITFETYRNKIREREILRLMWQQKVPHEPLISPARIENYYVAHRDEFKLEDQVKLRMIVLTNTPNEAVYSPKKIAEEIVAKLDEKVPFDELARVYSQESQASEGGVRPWLERKSLREDLAQVAFQLNPGQHSKPIETPQGVFILQVEDKKVSYTKTLSEVRDEIEATLRAEEMKRLRKDWIDQLKKKSFISYF